MTSQTGSIQLLLVQLAELNIQIRVEGQQLHINAPAGVLSESLKAALRHHRDDLISRLEQAGSSLASIDWPRISPDLENRNSPFPLSDVQHAYWVGRSKGLELGNVATHYYYELSCDDLDLNAFNRALCQLIQRHDMMRAVVNHDGKQQILSQVPPYAVSVLDFRTHPWEQQETALLEMRAELSHQQLPAHQWPLFDIRAIRLSDRNTRLYFSWDFLNLDAWSVYAICREWNLLYANPDALLAPIDISYRDYVLAERAMRDSDMYRLDRDYWWNRIDSIPAAPMLPIRSALGPDQQPTFTRRRFRLNVQQWGQLKGRSQAIGVTASGILLAAFSEVLAYWSKEPHFTLNMTLFSRLPMHEDVNKLVGDFTSLTLLEVDLRKPCSFKERAVAIQQQFLRDFEHRLISGVEVLREWSKRRKYGLQAAMPVVFTSCLVLNSAEGDDSGLLESFGPMIYGISQTPQVWLDNQVMEDKDGLVFNWDALEEVFAPGVLDDMFNCYCQFIEALANTAEAWDAPHPLALPVRQKEQRQLVNDTAAPMSAALLHEPFVACAMAKPDAIALIASGLHMSYGELLARSAALARELGERSLGPSQLVAVVIDKGWQQVVSVMGILIAGGAYLPIDPDLPKARRQQLFEQSGASFALVVEGADRESLVPGNVVCLEVPLAPPGEYLSVAPAMKQQPEQLAYVIFTSGSTGVPKGVMIDHRGAVNTVLQVNRLFGVNDTDKLLSVSSLSFDLSVYDIFGVLAAGGSIVIPDAVRSTDPEHWLELISRQGVTIWNSAPPLMSMLMSYMEGFQERPNESIRLALLSGDWIPVSLKSKTDRFLPASRLISLGGATEASIWSIYHPIDYVAPDWKSIPYGKPLPNQTMHVLNDRLQPCPVSVVGKIYIGGVGLAHGYLHDAEKTERQFIFLPDSGRRLYYTGDLGRYLADGSIEFMGREDSQIKLRGHRIELGEITAVLRSHPAVSEALAIVDGDSRTDQALWVYLQLDGDNKSALMAPINSNSTSHDYSPAVIAAAARRDERILPLTALSADAVELWNGLEELYFQALLQTFKSTSLFEVGMPCTIDLLMAEMHIAPRYGKWLQRAIAYLANRGLLTIRDGFFIAEKLPGSVDLASLARRVEQSLSAVLSLTDREARWFTLGAELLADILSETIHSAELYTADETALIYQKLFPDSHLQLQRAVKALAAARTGEKLRVLEVGAGLGSATHHLLPSLASHCASYDFTDISNYFLKRARDKFHEYEFVRYRLFDLEKPPAYQGYEAHSYDLIIASSVLHDVSDIAGTLAQLHSLLAPGGTLMLLEETKFLASFDLNMGLQQGFDVFADENIRKTHPLLSRNQWQKLIFDAGFENAEVLNVEGSVSDYVGFDVIVAQMPGSLERLDEEKLNAYLLEQLPSYMKPTGYQVLTEFPLTSNGKIDYAALAMPARTRGRSAEIVKPANELEEALLRIWCDVLGSEDVSVNSSFYEIGGDSLLLVEVRNQIKHRLNRHVPTTTLFEYPTIAGLAKYLGNHAEQETDLSAIQHRVGQQREAMNKQRAAKKGVKENV